MNTQKHSQITSLRPSIRIRPRFSLYIERSPDSINQSIIRYIEADSFTMIGQAITGHLTILIPSDRRQWWSPRLTMTVEEEKKGSRVRGMYSPDPGLWTMFMFMYAVFGFGCVIALMWGSSQWALDQGYSGLIYALILLLLFLTTWLIARLGRRLSYGQMNEIHEHVEEILGQKID